MSGEIFIPECFSLEPEAAEVIRKTLNDPADAADVQHIVDRVFVPEMPDALETMPRSGMELDRLLLAATVLYWPQAVKCYENLKWPMKLLHDTLLDVRTWSLHHHRNYGVWGLCWDGALFIRAQMRALVVRFGRLQCNTNYPLWKELQDPDGKWLLPKGCQVINLHIPEHGAMPLQGCLDSMEQMREFYRIYRPEIEWQAFVCHSWLLDPQLAELLPPSSNIVQFQKLGTIIGEPDKKTDTIFRVFGVKAVQEGVSSVPWTTSMQKTLGKFVLDGGEFHPAWMVIPR